MYHNCDICNRTIIEGRQDPQDKGSYEVAKITPLGSKYLKTCESCHKKYTKMELREVRELKKKGRGVNF